MTIAGEVDLSGSISEVLCTGTSAAHDAVENSEFAQHLAKGELQREVYIHYLIMLWNVYDTLERGLDKHASHPILQPTYNPTVLSRASNIASDISYLLHVPESSWKLHPAAKSIFASPPRPLARYISHLHNISDSEPHLLLSHAYVRYLGDLSGGRTIRYRIAQSFGLDVAEGSGIKFYEFTELGSTKVGTPGDIKRIKEWFRDGMNTAVGDDRSMKAVLLDEANKAFTFNGNIFSLLAGQEPVDNNEPEADTTGLSVDSPDLLAQAPKERLVSLGGVISFVIAVSLAHFILVVGGFTGEKGYDKLRAIVRWFYN